jgi:IS30 family transposase
MAGVARSAGHRVCRSPATISRELRRNHDPETGRYRPFAAHRLAAPATRPKIARDPVLRGFVQDKLGQKWTAEQISHALRAELPHHHPERHVVHETTLLPGGVPT